MKRYSHPSADHQHQWVYDMKTCCYILKCLICKKLTQVRRMKGEVKLGDRVKILADGDTMEVIR